MTNETLDKLILIVENGELITENDIHELTELEEQYKVAMSELCVKGDIYQSIFMRNKMVDIKKLIDKAEKNKENFNVEMNNDNDICVER